MPSKKRKYNARFPAGRIKKIMQTDEEVGKVAQAVPIIISRTLELFVESLLSKAMQVTMSRNAKTLSPSHVKQCILAESRFDFLRDLVKNIPDVSAAEEKEMMSAENSPNSSRFSDMTVPPRRIVREDSNSSSSCDVRVQQIIQPPVAIKRKMSTEVDLAFKPQRTETVTSTIISADTAIDLTKKPDEKPVITANFYQETLLTDEVNTQHRSVIQVNPTYASPQPSTSSYTNMTPVEPVQRVEIPVPKPDRPVFYLDVSQNNKHTIVSPKTPSTPILIDKTLRLKLDKPTTPVLNISKPATPTTPVLNITKPVAPILNIDFSKNLAKPEIKVLDKTVAGIVGVAKDNKNSVKHLQRQNSKAKEVKRVEPKVQPPPVDIDHLNSGNLQIDEDYDT